MSEENTLPKITFEKAKELWLKSYPRGVDLAYVDYREDLNDHLDILQEVVLTGYSDKFNDKEFEWYDEQRADAVHEYIKEVYAEYDVDDIEDELRSMVYDSDTSNVFKDLMRNTRAQVFFYDLDHEVPGYPDNNEKAAKEVAKVLKMDFKSHRDKLVELVANASYGGTLCLLFSADVSWFEGDPKNDKKYVVIKDATVCVMDRWNGSGHDVHGLGDFKVRMDRTRFKLDEDAPGYSFAGDVCGMTVDEATLVETNDIKGVIGPKPPREPSEAEKMEMMYEKLWKEGKCSLGDMNPKRHKETYYINDFPCGTKCKTCGNFWID